MILLRQLNNPSVIGPNTRTITTLLCNLQFTYNMFIRLKKFKSLDALVDYYKSHSITTNSTLFLKDPPHRVCLLLS